MRSLLVISFLLVCTTSFTFSPLRRLLAGNRVEYEEKANVAHRGKEGGYQYVWKELLEPRPNKYSNTVFTGHEACDCDALGSSMGLATLLGSKHWAICINGANKEMQYVMDYFNIAMPLKTNHSAWEGKDWGLVDVNEESQIPMGVAKDGIVLIVDHHRFGRGTVDQAKPIYIQNRAWEQGQEVPEGQIAGALLAGIISDTYNLVGPTTTIYDVTARDYLAKRAGITGVEETVYPNKTDEQLTEYITAIRNLKQAEMVDYAFYNVVDIMAQTSAFIVVENGQGTEAEVLAHVFNGSFVRNEQMFNTHGQLVSRKLQLVPPLSHYWGLSSDQIAQL